MTEDLIARLREPRNSSIYGGCQNCDDALKEEAADTIARLQADNERLNDRNVEVSMLAHKWMVAHDKRAAGMPYDFPCPADLPASEAQSHLLREEGERLRGALEPFAAAWAMYPPPKPGEEDLHCDAVFGAVDLSDFEAARSALSGGKIMSDPRTASAPVFALRGATSTVDFEIRKGVGTLVGTADSAEQAKAFVLRNKLRFPTLRVERVETTVSREVIYRPRGAAS